MRMTITFMRRQKITRGGNPPRCAVHWAANINEQEKTMSKSQDAKKSTKKEPAKTMKEKKEAKKVKKEEKQRQQ
jgi:hypothetical protein